jgi:ATP-binding cassette subfamily F protein 3
MLLTADIEQKIIGTKLLFTDLRMTVETGEKMAIVGRNGVGKTSLFRMLTGEDTDFEGSVSVSRNVQMVATAQEHHDLGSQTVMAYILSKLPEYPGLKAIIDTYPLTMGDDVAKISTYSEALERFNSLDYFTVEDRIQQSLEDYQLDGKAEQSMKSLSGGQKRFVELIRVEHSHADLALIDEPTNHMDYAAKAAFLKWFSTTKRAVVVISHDRDVLEQVSRIIEIKDTHAENFVGNYKAYLQQNAQRTANALNEYDTTQRRIENIKKQIQFARAKKSSWSGTADKKNPFLVMENRLTKELVGLTETERPSFWIDQESIGELKPSAEVSYQKHKAKNIHIQRQHGAERQRELLELTEVQVGYKDPLFDPISVRMVTGDRVQLIGRNGAGKTTLVRAIMARAQEERPATLLHGFIACDTKLRINNYEQELGDDLLSLPLDQAIEALYADFDQTLSNEQLMRVMASYLFDPYADRLLPVRNLSGGQKARLQLIKLFANDPNLLILDEPTNHLDLPSIEELEAALKQYTGALMYISHDSYLAKHLGGTKIHIERSIEA